MNIFIALWIFYKRLVLPSFVVSALLAAFYFEVGEVIQGTGVAYIFLTPVFHYVLYDLTSPKEYFFYYNLGINKLLLWVNSIVLSLIIGVILMLI